MRPESSQQKHVQVAKSIASRGRFPLIAAVGEPSILVDLDLFCPVQVPHEEPQLVDAHVLVVGSRAARAPAAWASANPASPVLQMRGRVLQKLYFGPSCLLLAKELRDPVEFVSAVAIAASQLRTPADTSSDPFDLSPRELESLTLLSEGMQIKRVAATMQISVHTVQQHVTNARRKLGVRTRLSAVLMAIRRGLIPFPE